jgi:hypothetical protein
MATQTTEHSLDELAKGLATGHLSRGKALRWMGGALLGAALASVPGVALADDDCRRLGRECRRDSQCCSRNCVRRGDDKVCACPEGKSRCGERCVNRKRNENHCGECFNRCDEGEECVRGECQGSCPPGETVCTGCACETVACTPETFGCNPNVVDPDGGFCFANPEGGGTTCACGFGQCTNDCSVCANLGLVCVSSPACNAELDMQCVGPCCVRPGNPCSADSQCCGGNCEGDTCGCIQQCQGPCFSDSECCSGLICSLDSGLCEDPLAGCQSVL